MRYLDQAAKLDQFIGLYGQAYRAGLLSEHVEMFREAGGVVRPAASGSGAHWAVVDGSNVYPVVCSELIVVDTEDGPVSGRCGYLAELEGACERHGAILADWAAQSEAEAVAWERARDC